MGDFLSFGILGLIQGITEFLPISSTGHLILARDVFGISTENGLAIDAVLQLATALAVTAYFARDILGLMRRGERGLLLALVAGTVPAVIIGIFLEDLMTTAFRSATLVAYALIAGSLVMLAAELIARAGGPRGTRDFLLKIHSISLASARSEGLSAHPPSFVGATIIGIFQSLALIPGMSRSGMVISGGLFLGLSREAAARFGFLLSVPIIAGSGLKKLFDLGTEGVLASVGPDLLVGSAAAFVSGLAAIHVLLIFVRKYPLYPFIVYRLALAVAIFAFL